MCLVTFHYWQFYVTQHSDDFSVASVPVLHLSLSLSVCISLSLTAEAINGRLGLHTHLLVIHAHKYPAPHSLLQSLPLVVSMCSQPGCRQVQPAVWRGQQGQDGHLRSAQQQCREVSAARCRDIASCTRHVSGRGSHVQPETLAEQTLHPGMDHSQLCLFYTYTMRATVYGLVRDAHTHL